MPQMSNIVSAAPAFTLVSLVPSSGDTTPARWRIEGAPSPLGMPKLSIGSRYNGQKTARRVELQFEHPYYVMDLATDQLRLLHKIPFTVSAVLPDGVPTLTIHECVDRFAAIVNSALVKDVFKSGYAPT